MARRIPVLAAPILTLLFAFPVSAAQGCPASASGYQAVDVNWDWEPGDAIPPADVLWQTTLAGIAAEGETVQDHITMFGFSSVEELYGFALQGWRSADRNLDGTACLKLLPEHQRGIPAYVFLLGDNSANTPR